MSLQSKRMHKIYIYILPLSSKWCLCCIVLYCIVLYADMIHRMLLEWSRLSSWRATLMNTASPSLPSQRTSDRNTIQYHTIQYKTYQCRHIHRNETSDPTVYLYGMHAFCIVLQRSIERCMDLALVDRRVQRLIAQHPALDSISMV